jgi:hypothetical protein
MASKTTSREGDEMTVRQITAVTCNDVDDSVFALPEAVKKEVATAKVAPQFVPKNRKARAVLPGLFTFRFGVRCVQVLATTAVRSNFCLSESLSPLLVRPLSLGPHFRSSNPCHLCSSPSPNIGKLTTTSLAQCFPTPAGTLPACYLTDLLC